jgi:heat-inducible transcriptional repressor
MNEEPLSEREQIVLEAVIRTYVETAEPTGSKTVANRFGLGISPATVRNTMSELEAKGYLMHPHTSAGRVPTDRAYRLYVNALLHQPRSIANITQAVRPQLASADRTIADQLIRHAAQVLGLLTQDLGIATGPRVENAILDRLELIPLSAGKLLLVLVLRGSGVRTIYVDVPAEVAPASVASITQLLNERLSGLRLSEIRMTVVDRLRDSAPADDLAAQELLNIFLQSADDWLESRSAESLHLGHASVLAEQPEFQSEERLRGLIELTEQRDLLDRVLGERMTGAGGLHITIGSEHGNEALSRFTLVTSEYNVGHLRGVIGVIGPTRMPYERVIALVESTSMLVSEFLRNEPH